MLLRSLNFLMILAVLASGQAASPSIGPDASHEITVYDTEILIYLLPEAHQVRAAGRDIAWVLQTNNKLDQANFYYFWVIDTVHKNAVGSVTVGYFSVNKWTADVEDDDEYSVVTSKEIAGVQKIIREEHHIDQATIEKYRRLNP